MNKIKVNIGTFNLVKGFAIVMIVVGHSLLNYNVLSNVNSAVFFVLYNIFRSFFTLFIFITGYGFVGTSILKLFKKSFKELFKPYLIVTAIVALLFPAIYYPINKWWPWIISEDIKHVLAYLFAIPGGRNIVIFGYQVYESYVVYYLIMTFIGINLLNIITKIKKEKIQLLLIVLCIAISYVLFENDFIYFSLPQGFASVAFLYLGYYVRKHDLYSKMFNHKILLLIIILIGLVESLFGDFNFAYGQYNCFLINIIGLICRTFIIGYLAIVVQPNNAFANTLRKAGIYTYWIMCIHSVELACIPWNLYREKLSGVPLLALFGELILKIVLFVIAIKVLKKISISKYRRNKMLQNGKL